jgi:ABC-type nitrate/sulfonate/bicarbonate transport system, permease component
MSREQAISAATAEGAPLSRPHPSEEAIAEIARPLSLAEKIWNQPLVRKAFILALLAVVWQWYAQRLDNPLMFPTFSASFVALVNAFMHGELGSRVLVSLKVLLSGYAIGIVLATLLAAIANGTRLGNDLLEVLTAMFNPLPAIALLPVALLWFGLGNGSITFVLIHAVLWPVALSTHTGFCLHQRHHPHGGAQLWPERLALCGADTHTGGVPVHTDRAENGWAFAWRTLIAAELVFGVSSGSGGIGWFIYENKNQLEIAYVFAGLLTVIGIGGLMDSLFRLVEQRTVNRWGMKF